MPDNTNEVPGTESAWRLEAKAFTYGHAAELARTALANYKEGEA